MVVYNLACDNAHAFEGWFASPEMFDAQSLSCPVCGSTNVVKQPSAPYIGKRSNDTPAGEMARLPAEAVREMQAKILDYIVKTTEDVGKNFPEEARRIHYRESPERPIRGQASGQQVKELKEEGIDVVPLPLPPVPPGQLH